MSLSPDTDACFKYDVYGLTLQTNRRLAGLIPSSVHTPTDVWIDLMADGDAQLPSAEVETVSSGLNTHSKVDGVSYHLWFRGDGQLDFEIDAAGCHISATWTRSVLNEVTALLLGPVLGFAMRLRGILCLHACVLEVGSHAIAIVGETGAGKSTTAAALASRGHAILSDDIAVLDDRSTHWLVQSGYPRLRLWPETLRALYGSEDGLTRVFSFTEKRFIDLADNCSDRSWRFHRHPLPLAAIYVLGERQLELSSPAIKAIDPVMAVMTLMRQRSASHLSFDAVQHTQEFAKLSHVAMCVPVRNVTRRDGLDTLPQLCDAIVQDAANIGAPELCTQP